MGNIKAPLKCPARCNFFAEPFAQSPLAGNFVRREFTPSLDIWNFRQTCPASPADFATLYLVVTLRPSVITLTAEPFDLWPWNLTCMVLICWDNYISTSKSFSVISWLLVSVSLISNTKYLQWSKKESSRPGSCELIFYYISETILFAQIVLMEIGRTVYALNCAVRLCIFWAVNFLLLRTVFTQPMNNAFQVWKQCTNWQTNQESTSLYKWSCTNKTRRSLTISCMTSSKSNPSLVVIC